MTVCMLQVTAARRLQLRAASINQSSSHTRVRERKKYDREGKSGIQEGNVTCQQCNRWWRVAKRQLEQILGAVLEAHSQLRSEATSRLDLLIRINHIWRQFRLLSV